MKTAIWTAGLVLFLALTSLAFVFKPLPGSAERSGERAAAAEPDRRDRLDAMRGDLRATFEAVRADLDTETERLQERASRFDTSALVELLARWEVSESVRPSVSKEIREKLSSWRRSSGVEFAMVVTQSGRLIASANVAIARDRSATAAERDIFGSFIKPHVGGRDSSGVIDAIPRAFIDRDESDLPGIEESPSTLVVAAVLPLRVIPETAPSFFITGSSLASVLARLESSASGDVAEPIDWHLVATAGSGVPRVVAGARSGSLLRRSMVDELRSERFSELGAFKLVGPQVGRWASLRSPSGDFIGAWGLSISQSYLDDIMRPKTDGMVTPGFDAFPDMTDVAVIGGLLLLGVGALWGFLTLWARFVQPAPTDRVQRASAGSRSENRNATSAERAQTFVDRFEVSCRYFLQRAQGLFDEKLRDAGVLVDDLDATTRKQFQGLAERVDGFSEELRASDGAFEKKFADIERTLRSFVGVLEEGWREKSIRSVGAATDRAVSDQGAAVDCLREEVEQARQDGARLVEEVKALRETDSKLREQLAESASTEAELRVRLEETHLRAEQAVLQENAAVRRLQAVEASEKTVRRQANVLNRRVDELSVQAERCGELDKLEARCGELEQFRSRCVELESEVSRLAQDVGVQREHAGDLERQLAEARDALRASAETVSEERTESSRLREEVEQARKLLEEERGRFDETQAELEGRARESAREASERLDAATVALEKRAGELTLEVDEIRRELKAVRNSEAVLKEERVALENENASLREEREVYRAKATKLEQQNATIVHQIEALKVDLDDAKRQVADAQERLDSAQSGELDPLSGLMGMDDTSIESSDAAQDREDFLRLYEEVDEMRTQLEIESRGRRELQEERDSLLQEIERIRLEVKDSGAAARSDSEVVAHCATLERLKAELEDRVVALTRQVEEIRDEFDGVQGFQGSLVTGNLPTPLVAVDTSLKIFVWNPAAEAFWGIPASEALGEKVDDLVLFSTELRGQIAGDLRQRLCDQKPSSTPFLSIRPAEGSKKHFRLHYEPVPGLDASPAGVILSVEDVTELTSRAVECELQTQFQDTLTASIPLALVVTDPNLCVISWNSHASDLLGVEEHDALGQPVFGLPLDANVQEFEREFRAIAETGRAGRFVNRPVVSVEDSEPNDQLVTVSPFVTDSGEFRGWVLLVEEICGETA